ncbi:MAG: hypothetical protein R2731_10310 [Nocardioides sp.]
MVATDGAHRVERRTVVGAASQRHRGVAVPQIVRNGRLYVATLSRSTVRAVAGSVRKVRVRYRLAAKAPRQLQVTDLATDRVSPAWANPGDVAVRRRTAASSRPPR